jgi:hypothetical protein
MKWNVEDIDVYLKSKEYVDTVVVPLVPISWTKELKSTVSMGEFIQTIGISLERQFKGRMVLFPPFTYLKSESKESRYERLKQWEAEIVQEETKVVFYITADVDWKQLEKDLDEKLIWLPALPLEHMDAEGKDQILKEQVNQVMPIFMSAWKK